MAPLSTQLSTLFGSPRIEVRNLPAPGRDSKYNPGQGTVDPTHVNNHGFFALFALLGVGLVLGSCWFFFWAKNGGFQWRKGDWEDYKSTVLRRKGPNGTTLSGATKSTKLGGGSVVANGGQDVTEKGFRQGFKPARKGNMPRSTENSDDADVKAYRHEKPARVGGLNRQADTIFTQDFAPSSIYNYSDAISEPVPGTHVPINTPRVKKENKRSKIDMTPTTPTPKKDARSRFYNQTPNSNASTDSQRPLRPNAASPGGYNTPTRSRQHSPSKNTHTSIPGSFFEDSSEYESRYGGSNSDAVTEESRGTKAYFHPIPGLASGAKGTGGFRRGRGRRDSLSDSEGEAGTQFS